MDNGETTIVATEESSPAVTVEQTPPSEATQMAQESIQNLDAWRELGIRLGSVEAMVGQTNQLLQTLMQSMSEVEEEVEEVKEEVKPETEGESGEELPAEPEQKSSGNPGRVGLLKMILG